MYLKIMAEENLPDRDPCKGFRLIECQSVEFYRTSNSDGDRGFENVPGAPLFHVAQANFINGDFSVIVLKSNAYVLNDNGKTVESFEASPVLDEKRQVLKELKDMDRLFSR